MASLENESDVSDIADLVVGTYVTSPPYLLMRLRMRLTGTAAPTDAEWAGALRRLLDHLEANPVPDVVRDIRDGSEAR